MAVESTPREIVIWAVSDGRAGIENQVLGLAEAVARLTPAQVEIKRVKYDGILGRLPQTLNFAPRWSLSPKSDRIAAPWPDVWIAAGRATLALSTRVKRWSGGRTFVVQVQHPRRPLKKFDLVIPPEHDRLKGPNVFPILGSPHRVTSERLAEEHERFRTQLDVLLKPRVAVLVGGRSKSFRLPKEHAEELAVQIKGAVERARGSLLLTFSRRTPPEARRVITERLKGLRGWIWDGLGPNPYYAFLDAAEVVLVTEDSTNMAVEAASAGKPVLVMDMPGNGPKFRRLRDQMELRGMARPFRGVIERWPCKPLQETERAATEVVRRLGVTNEADPG
ncbi:MAG TPA: mitochondrial fission ELM1 family protein [Caulobacteraceae bacterium]